MNNTDISTSMKLYVILCTLFSTIIITGNLIFQKFIIISIFSYSLEISVGVLLYPLTFLISDLVTEFYGKVSAKLMVKIAAFCSLVILGLVSLSDLLNATEWSVVDNDIFHIVFNAYGIGAIASIIANYFGQITDIHAFSYIKFLTKGKHLWLRNNVSTILGQIVDSILVISILCFFDIISWKQFLIVFLSSLSFKVIAALLDTPICYLGYYLIKKSIKGTVTS